MQREYRQNKYAPLLMTGVLFACFLAACVVFILTMRADNETRSRSYMQEAARQRRVAVMNKIYGDFETLRGIASGLGSAGLQGGGALDAYLSAAFIGNSFVLMGVTDADGRTVAVATDGRVLDAQEVARVAYLQRPMMGEGISETVYEPYLGVMVNYYDTHVRRGDETGGMLWAAATNLSLQEIMAVPVFQGQGYFGLFDGNGVMIAPGRDPNPKVAPGASLFDIGTFADAERRTIEEALRQETPGSFAFRVDGIEQLVTLEPLRLNDWTVISIIGRSTVGAWYDRAIKGVGLLIAVACAVFLSLMYWQVRTAERNRAELERIAYVDPVTGIRNHAKFLVDAQKMLGANPEKSYAVWTMDIKNFSRINSIFGNDMGDRVLQQAAHVLGGNGGRDAIHCRIAADIFAGIRPCGARREQKAWFDGAMRALARRETLPDDQVRIDFAMGVFVAAGGQPRMSVDEMLNRSTLARRAAKEQVGNGFAFFGAEMEERLVRLTELEASAREALACGEIAFVLQPKVCLRDGYEIVGAEALARWYHPVHGCIPPGDFIPLFEGNGFIAELDRAIFERVCVWLQDRYDALAGAGGPLRVSVNVSRQGMFGDEFLDFYTRTKNRYGIADGVLELEFTESIVLDDNEMFRDVVMALQRRGFACSIDDFGAGYSSLNVLKDLPMDVLKLDAQFMRGGGDRYRSEVVLASFVEMAGQLGIQTVAEGVETPEQVEFLRRIGCDMVQGYVFSKPLPPGDFEVLFRTAGGNMAL